MQKELDEMKTGLIPCAQLAAERIKCSLDPEKAESEQCKEVLRNEMLCFSRALFPDLHKRAMACADERATRKEHSPECVETLNELPKTYHMFWYRVFNTVQSCEKDAHDAITSAEKELGSMPEEERKRFVEDVQVNQKMCMMEHGCGDELKAWQRCHDGAVEGGKQTKTECAAEWRKVRKCWVGFLMSTSAIAGDPQAVEAVSTTRLEQPE